MALAPDETPTFTVGELNRLIRYALSITFPDEVWVEGEISSLKRHPSGHVYFELVDAGDGARQADATLQVALYKSNKEGVNAQLKRAARLHPGADVRMADGIHVRIRGTLDYYPPAGKLQLRMTAIDPAHTLGRMAAERDRVLAMLRAEGLLDRNAALPVPALPLRIGLVTSAGSAAHADFLHELEASGLGWRVTLVDSRVQGLGADIEVVAALRTLAAMDLDVIALVRGGGARTDLMTFDAEIIARTIATTAMPVFTGIGHETDTSVADAVASRSFKTPTACAAALVEQARAAIDRAEGAWAQIERAARHALDRHERHLLATGRHVAFATRAQLDLRAQRVDATIDRLTRCGPAAVHAAEQRLHLHAARTDAVDPLRALARGWSITRTADGRVVRDASTLSNDDELITQLAAGSVRSRVTHTDTDTDTDTDIDVDQAGPP